MEEETPIKIKFAHPRRDAARLFEQARTLLVLCYALDPEKQKEREQAMVAGDIKKAWEAAKQRHANELAAKQVELAGKDDELAKVNEQLNAYKTQLTGAQRIITDLSSKVTELGTHLNDPEDEQALSEMRGNG